MTSQRRKSSLEAKVEKLYIELHDLAKRVRIDAIAERFIRGDHAIRSGDYVKFSDGHAARVDMSNSEGRWLYRDRRGSLIEPFAVPPENGIERLYTIAEVAEIIAQLSRKEAR